MRASPFLAPFIAGWFLQAAAAIAAPVLVTPPGMSPKAMSRAAAAAEQGVVRARTVLVDTSALRVSRDALVGQTAALTMEVPLFEDVTAIVFFDRAERLPSGAMAYTGQVLGRPWSSAVLVDNDGVVAANFVAPGFTYQIRFAGNGLHEVRQIDQSAFSDHGSLTVPEVNLPPSGKSAPMLDTADFIDVLVPYTAAARAGAGGTAAMNTLVALGITETNAAYATSGAVQRIRLAGAFEVSYADSGDMAVDLNRLRARNDGYLEEVHAARDATGADLVSLWVNNGGGGCGIGAFMGTVTPTFESSGFNVTARGCATGNYSFGHELGHNMGLRHDFFMDPATTPYAYAHGFADPPHGFRTIMAYNNACTAAVPSVNCTRIQQFSNPAVNYSGFPSGEPVHANSAQALNNTALTVANFRTAIAAGGAGSVVVESAKSVGEGAGTVSVTVNRVGGSAGAASVAYGTASGTATAGLDFTTTTGTLNWGAGDAAARTITVPIVSDALGEGDETFAVTLSSPVGVAIATGGGTGTVLIRNAQPDVFPLGCVMPSGFVTPGGATTGWIVDTSESAEGSCSLRSNAMANAAGGQFNKARIAYTANLAAGNVTFKRKVSSELNWDCFRFLVDGVEQNVGGTCSNVGGLGASGEVAWGDVTVPIAAGVHTLVWSYEKDNLDTGGSDAAWIDLVSLPAAALLPSTTTLTSSANPSGLGQPITYTATVAGSGATPTGTVAFHEAGVNMAGCSAIAPVSGSATCGATGGAFGAYSITATYSGNATYAASVSSTLVQVVTPRSGTDFNGDGKADILFRNFVTGQVYQMLMNGLTVAGGALAYTEADTAWRIVADADFNGDGVTDLVWRNDSTGQVYLMPFASSGTPSGGAVIHTEANAAWKIVHTPDLDGDGKADLLWWNSATGQVWAMLMNGAAIAGQGLVFTEADTAWKIVATGDFAGSGKRNQLLWRNDATGQVYLMTVTYSGGVFGQSGVLIYTEGNTAWRIIAAADHDGDGRSDILWRNGTTGQVYGMLMNGGTIGSQAMIHTEANTAWKIVAQADYDGNGKADLLWRNDSTGQVYQMLMNGLGIASQDLVYTEANTAWRILGPWEYGLATGIQP